MRNARGQKFFCDNFQFRSIIPIMEYNYNAIILHKRDLAEFDRIYTLYTLEAGKIRAVGKGTRRSNAKLAGYLEPVTYSEVFVVKGKGLGRITGAVTVENFLHIKLNFECLQRVFRVFGILEKVLGEEEKDERIFLLILQFLRSMNEASDKECAKEKLDIMALGFLFKFLGELGYKLEAEKCVRCGERLVEQNNSFSLSQGGILCCRCRVYDRKALAIQGNAIKLIRIFLRNKIENLAKLRTSSEDIARLNHIVREFIRWTLE